MSTPVDRLLGALRSHGHESHPAGNGWTVRCPAHDDQRPSLSITEGDAGRALVHCHAGCTAEAVVMAVGLKLVDLMPETPTTVRPMPRATRKPTAKAPAPLTPATFATARDAVAELEEQHGQRAAMWTYTDAAGEPVGVVVRWDTPEGKDIRPVSKTAGPPEGWIIGGMDKPRPLYRLPELLSRAGERVYVVEGEKCADALAGLGLLATTSPHGSKSAGKADWTPLAGREVVVLPDHDKPGALYAGEVAGILAKLTPAATVRTVKLAYAWPDLPAGGDVADVVEGAEAPDSIKAKLAELVDAVTPKPTGPVLVCLADVDPREIKWLWPGRVPMGRLTLLVGRPGEGKSFLTTDMAARITTGTPWPDGSDCPIGSVILVSAEDDPGDTIRPRLDAHGADVRKVHLLSAVRRMGEDGQPYEVLFTLADVAALEAALKATPDCRLIVVDPIGSFLGGDTDAHRDNEVRGVLAPVAKLAEKYGPAVLVVAHRRKSAGSNADDLALGSRAFTGIARAVWHLSRDKDDKPRRLLLPGKNNLAPEGNGLAFIISGEPAAVAWEHDPVAMSADDALAAEINAGDDHKPGPEPEAQNQAADWLAVELEDLQEHPVKELKEAAKAAGLAWRTVQKASQRLGVKVHRGSFGGSCVWQLPKPKASPSPIRANPAENGEPGAIGANGDLPGNPHDSAGRDSQSRQDVSLGADEPAGLDEPPLPG